MRKFDADEKSRSPESRSLLPLMILPLPPDQDVTLVAQSFNHVMALFQEKPSVYILQVAGLKPSNSTHMTTQGPHSDAGLCSFMLVFLYLYDERLGRDIRSLPPSH